MNFFLKMDGIVNGDWKEVFWPFWIIFSILIGLSFSLLLILLTKLCTIFCIEAEAQERKSY